MYLYKKNVLENVGLLGNILNSIKTIYEEPIVKITLNRENPEAMPLKTEM